MCWYQGIARAYVCQFTFKFCDSLKFQKIFNYLFSIRLFIADTILMGRIILGFPIRQQWPVPLLAFMQIN